jgi:hypothetical protein
MFPRVREGVAAARFADGDASDGGLGGGALDEESDGGESD